MSAFSLPIKISSPDSFFCLNYPASFASQQVLNKDPTVWLDGARPDSTSIPPSFYWNTPMQLHVALNPKNTFASIEKLAKFSEITFFKANKNQRKKFNKLTFVNSELTEC